MLTAMLLLTGCEPPSLDSGDCADDVPTYADWGAGFFANYCRSCHSAESPSRFGAPEGVDFDTQAEIRAQAAGIARTVLEEGSMPVGGGVPEAELAALERYLGCAP